MARWRWRRSDGSGSHRYGAELRAREARVVSRQMALVERVFSNEKKDKGEWHLVA
jgi:hypothetical protein